RGQNSVVTVTGDYIAGGVWTVSGDLAFDPATFTYGGPVVAVESTGGTLTLDFAQGSNFRATLTENTTLAVENLAGAAHVTEFEPEITQDATGGRTLPLPVNFKALGGSDTAIASAASATTVLSAKTFDSGATWRYSMQESA